MSIKLRLAKNSTYISGHAKNPSTLGMDSIICKKSISNFSTIITCFHLAKLLVLLFANLLNKRNVKITRRKTTTTITAYITILLSLHPIQNPSCFPYPSLQPSHSTPPLLSTQPLVEQNDLRWHLAITCFLLQTSPM